MAHDGGEGDINPQPRKIWAEALDGAANAVNARLIPVSQICFAGTLLTCVVVRMIRILSILECWRRRRAGDGGDIDPRNRFPLSTD